LYSVIDSAVVEERVCKIDVNRLCDLFDKKQQSNFFAIQYFDKLFAYRNKLCERNNFVEKLSK